MTMALFTETVTLRTRTKTGKDALGNAIYEWAEVDSPAWVETRQGTETTDARESSTANSWVFLPDGAPVKAVSQVRWRGELWDVDGEPGIQPGGFVVEGYVQIAIKRVSG